MATRITIITIMGTMVIRITVVITATHTTVAHITIRDTMVGVIMGAGTTGKSIAVTVVTDVVVITDAGLFSPLLYSLLH